MKILKTWVEHEMAKRKWQESNFREAAGMSYMDVKRVMDDTALHSNMTKAFKAFRSIAKAFNVPLETVLYQAELYSDNEQQPVPVPKLVESLNEEQKDLIGRLAKQLIKK